MNSKGGEEEGRGHLANDGSGSILCNERGGVGQPSIWIGQKFKKKPPIPKGKGGCIDKILDKKEMKFIRLQEPFGPEFSSVRSIAVPGS